MQHLSIRPLTPLPPHTLYESITADRLIVEISLYFLQNKPPNTHKLQDFDEQRRYGRYTRHRSMSVSTQTVRKGVPDWCGLHHRTSGLIRLQV